MLFEMQIFLYMMKHTSVVNVDYTRHKGISHITSIHKSDGFI